MKKIILTLLCISILTITNAQETGIDNKFILGGSMNFLIQNNTYPLTSLSLITRTGGIYSGGTNDIRYTTLAFSPYFGKEISSNLMVGLQFDYRKEKIEQDDVPVFVLGQSNPNTVDIKRNSNQVGIGIFIRYIVNPSNQFSFFFQPYAQYNLLNEDLSEDSIVRRQEKANFLELGVGLGMIYNVNNKIRAVLRSGGLNYVTGKWEIKNTDTGKNFNSFGTNFSLSNIYLGFEIRI